MRTDDPVKDAEKWYEFCEESKEDYGYYEDHMADIETDMALEERFFG